MIILKNASILGQRRDGVGRRGRGGKDYDGGGGNS